MKAGIIYLLIVLTIIFSCQKEQDESIVKVSKQLEQFLDLEAEIISSPPKLLSTTSIIEIEFRESVVPEHLRGTILDQNPFSFEPEIPGDAIWLSSRVLQFKPHASLPAGYTIKGNLNGKIAFGYQKNVNDFSFSFKVAEQEILKVEGEFTAVPDQKNTVIYTGTIHFAQPVVPAETERAISFRGPDGMVKISIKDTNKPSKVIRFSSSHITRPKKGKSFEIILPGKYTADNKKWSKSLYLPGIDIFRILSHMDATESTSTRPVYAFRFSDPIKKGMDLSGFINVEPAISYETRLQGKYLYIDGDFIPGKSYTVNIAQGFPSVYGTKLFSKYSTEISFNNVKPEIKWLSKGVYLPSSNSHKLQFKSVNVARAYVRVLEIHQKNIGFFIQRNAILNRGSNADSEYGYYYRSLEYQDLDRVSEEIYKDTLQITDEKNKWIYSELDLGSVFRGRAQSVFVIEMRFSREDLTGRCVNTRDDLSGNVLYYEDDDYYTNPCRNGYYYSHGRKSKLLIASNIGITAKKSDNGVHVFLTDIITAQPLSNISLQLYNYQNRILASRTTDANGYTMFPDKGYYIYSHTDNGIALLKLNHTSWELNTFDIAGSSGGQKGTDVFTYLDRSVHRPGDTLHYSAIIRSDRKAPPAKQPVILKVRNPKGQTVLIQRSSSGSSGHVYWPIPTNLNDPTGNWIARLETGDQVFTKALKIETIKPNRLKISIDIPPVVSASDRFMSVMLQSNYLFGAPAAGLKCKIQLDLSSLSFSSAKYADYAFNSPLIRFSSRNLSLFDGALDTHGKHLRRYPMPVLSKSPGPLSGQMQVTVFERGGNFTEAKKRLVINPFVSYTGIKNIFINNRARLGENYNVPIIVVDPQGNPVSGHKLVVNVYVNRRHWWWDFDKRDQRDFRQMESTYLVSTTNYLSENKPLQHQLIMEDYGRHYIEVIDQTSGHQTGLFSSVSRWGGVLAEEETTKNFIEINSDKNIYNPGDIVSLVLKTPSSGTAYLSLEQGNNILFSEWQKLEDNETRFTFPVTSEMVPNCYASVSIVQPHNQSVNDIPMRTFGIKPLYVEDKNSRLPLSFTAPDELQPKENFEIIITSAARIPASYTIAIVDDGLLDLTDFQTPSPWNHFFQKLRLGIVTMDNFDEILGVLFPDINRFFSIGGGALAELIEKRLDRSQVRRFKPVVLFQKPQAIQPSQTISSKFTMPNYVGSVRLMIVGSGGHSYTSMEKTIPVKQALMVLPTVPRVIRPGDIFSLPVSVFSMDSAITSATVSLKTSKNLNTSGSKSVNVNFTGTDEEDTLFRITAGEKIGKASVSVSVKSGEHSADYHANLPVLASNPFYTEVLDTIANSRQSVTLRPESFGYNGTNAAKLAFSRLPDIQLDKRFAYLLRYPYGCIEQTTSAAFAQLFLPNLVDLKSHQQQVVTDNINAAIKELSRFQMSSGFSFWPVSDNYPPRYSDWGTNYTGHFLIAARTLGYHVPSTLYNHWLNDAQKNAKTVNTKNYRFQTYRIFLLALSGNPNIGAMNLVRENHLDQLDALSRKFLAVSYHLSGQKAAAEQIRNSGSAQVLSYREMGGSYGSALRDQSMMVYLCLLMEDQRTATQLLKRVSSKFRPSGWYSTQETAVTLLAVGTYYKTIPFTGGAITFDIKMDGKSEEVRLSGYQRVVELDNQWEKNIEITNKHNDPLFVSLITEGIPIEDRIKTEHRGIEITRRFFDEQGNPILINQRKQGDGFWIEYTVSSSFNEEIEELALSSIFPAGWEIINPRLNGINPPPWVQNLNTSTGEYMDIRDDRVNWFFNLRPNQKMKFVLKINPTFKGIYSLPPVVCESMYSPEFFARIASDQVTVK